ncbi:MAG: NAD-binding protein [Elusimicrobia bacterium]|nr:NAD-binding protein [Elusimicrobiota bacterium]
MSEIKNKLIGLFLAIIIVLSVGTLGYSVIEKWDAFDSLYMTVITLATVGYGETHPLSGTGRIFTIFLILGGIGIMTYIFTTLTSIVVEGHLKNIFRRIKMENDIASLNRHFIICGNTHTGMSIAFELKKTRRDFVIIVLNREEAQKLIAEGFNVVEGDATEDEALIKAGIKNAAGIFCTLRNDKDNAFISLTAKGLNPSIKIAGVQNETDGSIKNKLIRSGVDIVISPFFIGGLRMVSEMVRPTVVNFLDSMLRDTSQEDVRFEEIIIRDKKEIISKSIGDFKKIAGSSGVVVAIKRKAESKYEINPPDNVVLSEDDVLIMLGSSKKLGEIAKNLS